MITKREHDTLAFIVDYIQEHGMAPTSREIALGIGIASRGVVHRYLQSLEASGHIRLIPGRRRNIELTEHHRKWPANDDAMPLLGKIAAGEPIEAVDEGEVVRLSDYFVGEGHYALRVRGNSMIEEGILDDDIVVVQPTSIARTGQIVVALIDQSFATLKRIAYDEGGTIRLHPANALHRPQVYSADRVVVQGVFVGLLRLAEHYHHYSGANRF